MDLLSKTYYTQTYLQSFDVAVQISSQRKFKRITKKLLKKVGTIVVHLIIRSSHQGCFMKKGVPRNFTEFTGKHPCQIFLFNKVAGLRPATLLKRLGHKCFPTNFAKFLKTAFLQDTSGRLLLNNLLICQNSLCRYLLYVILLPF